MLFDHQYKHILKKTTRKRYSLKAYKAGIVAGDKVMLAQTITLVESQLESDRALADKLITSILPINKTSIRIGITGSPGVGKSTFIEAFGKYITGQNKKVAVLAIDPSSSKTKGSILGDKTRMEELSKDPLAFIRPTATGTALGGVANRTREAILLCEAAGFDVIIVETVGVGQSEIAVRNMVDGFQKQTPREVSRTLIVVALAEIRKYSVDHALGEQSCPVEVTKRC